MKSRVISVTSNVIGKKDVWELITNIDQWSEWDFNIEYSECIKNKTGQVSLFKVKHRIFFITGRGIVEEFRPYERFTLRIGLAGARLYRKYIMEDTKEGLKVSIVTSVSGFLAWLWNFLVVKRILKDTPEDLTIIVEQAKKNRHEKYITF